MSASIDGLTNFGAAVSLGGCDVGYIQEHQKKANNVARRVLNELQNPGHVLSEKEIKDLSRLISSLEAADSKLKQAGRPEAFSSSLSQLKAARESLQSGQPKGQASKGQSPARHASAPQPASQAPSNQTRIQELKKNIRLQIKKLPQVVKTSADRQVLLAIQKDILELKKLGEPNLNDLEKAIVCLIDSKQLGVSREEELYVARLLKSRPSFANALGRYKNETEAASLERAQKEIIGSLKSCCKSGKTFKELEEGSKIALVGALEMAIFSRLENFVEIHKIHIPENILYKTPSIIKELQAYKERVGEALEKAREEVLETLYQKVIDRNPNITREAFQSFLATYPGPNMVWIIPKIIQEAQEEIIDQLDLEREDVLDDLKKQLDEQRALDLESFSDFVRRVFPKQEWLVMNFRNGRILRPYSQGGDVHGNLGGGVCFANAAERSALLLQNPDLPDQKIEMGSTQRSRVAQKAYLEEKNNSSANAKVLKKFEIRQNFVRVIVIEENYNYLKQRVESLQKTIQEEKSLNSSDLKEIGEDLAEKELSLDVAKKALEFEQSLVATEEDLAEKELSLDVAEQDLKLEKFLVAGKDLPNRIFQELSKQVVAGNHVFMLELLKSGGGHAINVQIDPKRGIYRFMDDNVGLCAYENLKQLTENLGRLVTRYYYTEDSLFDTMTIFAVHPATP